MNILLKLRIFYYLHSHNFDKVSKLAECDIYDADKNRVLIKYQALSAFHLRNYYHARKCYEILASKNKASSDDYNKLAYIYSRHNEKENAIIAWCKASELKKNDKTSGSALNYIKQKGREVNLIEDTYFEKLSCIKPQLIPFNKIFITTIVLLFLALTTILSLHFGPGIIKKLMLANRDIEKVIIDDYNPNVLSSPKEETKPYSYSEAEVRKSFDFIKERILNNDVNQAQITLNKLRMSNASEGVLYKLSILEEFIEEPDYYDFKNTVSYRQIKESPELYDNIYIKWHGRIVNSTYDKKNKKIGFNLILGSDSEGIIDGVVPVIFEKAVIAENNSYASVFGKVLIDSSTIRIDGRFLIRD